MSGARDTQPTDRSPTSVRGQTIRRFCQLLSANNMSGETLTLVDRMRRVVSNLHCVQINGCRVRDRKFGLYCVETEKFSGEMCLKLYLKFIFWSCKWICIFFQWFKFISIIIILYMNFKLNSHWANYIFKVKKKLYFYIIVYFLSIGNSINYDKNLSFVRKYY